MTQTTPGKVLLLLGGLLALLSFGGGPGCGGDCLSAGTEEFGPTSCDQVECCNANATCRFVPKHTDAYGIEIGAHVTCPAPGSAQTGITEP